MNNRELEAMGELFNYVTIKHECNGEIITVQKEVMCAEDCIELFRTCMRAWGYAEKTVEDIFGQE